MSRQEIEAPTIEGVIEFENKYGLDFCLNI